MLQTLASDHPEYVPSPREDLDRQSDQDAARDEALHAFADLMARLPRALASVAELDRFGVTIKSSAIGEALEMLAAEGGEAVKALRENRVECE